MKVALIGYGRMGRQIEKLLILRGHTVDIVIDKDNPEDFTQEKFNGIDLAIEFTRPEAAADNLRRCIYFGVPVVCGTTGWNSQLSEIEDYCRVKGGTMLFASNFSIGVNVMRKVNSLLAKYMNALPQYQPTMQELHHIHKLDHPSGTAITIAEDVVSEVERLGSWSEEPNYNPNALPISAIRRSDIPGTHSICWESEVDEITITHRAKSRNGFVEGVVMAAEFLYDKKGVHSIDDLIKL